MTGKVLRMILGASVMAGFAAYAAPASAQATRTWVSGVGDDANPGSRTAPCKTFGGLAQPSCQQPWIRRGLDGTKMHSSIDRLGIA
jgi:hypothetical protein